MTFGKAVAQIAHQIGRVGHTSRFRAHDISVENCVLDRPQIAKMGSKVTMYSSAKLQHIILNFLSPASAPCIVSFLPEQSKGSRAFNASQVVQWQL